jgi:hypothetical protein
MAVPHIRLTISQRDDLAATCAAGRDKLENLASLIEAQKVTINRRRVDNVIAGSIGAEASIAVSRLLFGIAGPLRRDSTISAKDVLDGVSRALEVGFPGDKRFSKWPECYPAVLRLLTAPSIALAAKALDISYDFERVYVSGRFLTSVRPVFNENKDRVVGSAVVQTFRLEYQASNGEESSISIAVDSEDIRLLRQACDEALGKARVAKDQFEGEYKLETITPGGGTT